MIWVSCLLEMSIKRLRDKIASSEQKAKINTKQKANRERIASSEQKVKIGAPWGHESTAISSFEDIQWGKLLAWLEKNVCVLSERTSL